MEGRCVIRNLSVWFNKVANFRGKMANPSEIRVSFRSLTPPSTPDSGPESCFQGSVMTLFIAAVGLP